MRAWPLIARLSRPAIAVAALYAFVLGTFLASIPPGPLAAASHILCSPAAAGDPVPAQPAAHERDCCTPACPGGAQLPPPAPAFFAPPSPAPAAVAWNVRRDPARAGSIIRDNRARGPPLA